MSANEQSKQQAPHYAQSEDKGCEQHWDRMWKLYREAWFVGNVTKYVERYRSKNGIDDLKKARHYLDKLIELEEAECNNIEKTAVESDPTKAVPQAHCLTAGCYNRPLLNSSMCHRCLGQKWDNEESPIYGAE